MARRYPDSILLGKVIDAYGDVALPDNTVNHTGSATLRIVGTGAQQMSGNATSTGGLMVLDIDKPSGTLTLSGTIRTVKNWTYHQGTIDASTNNSTVVFGASLTLSGSQALYNVRFDGYKTA